MAVELRSPAITEDPRITRTKQAVVDAAVDLLIEGGPSAVTIDAIVARSKVAKSTIYRHWDTRDDVLVDVLHTCGPELPDPAEDVPVVEALREILYAVVDMTADPGTARVLSTLILLRMELDAILFQQQQLEKAQLKTLDRVLARGVAEGVIRPGYDVQQASAHLVGPLIFAHLTGSLPSDRRLADQTIDVFLAAYGT